MVFAHVRDRAGTPPAIAAQIPLAQRLRSLDAVRSGGYPCDTCPGCIETMIAGRDDRGRDVLLHRICGEFLEMPGLRLTAGQAQRLWNIDKTTCTGLLDFLVGRQFLCRTGRGYYIRAAEGPLPCPRFSR